MAITVAALSGLLAEVIDLNLYVDSKTIVDMPLKTSPANIATAFAKLNLPNPAQHPQERSSAVESFIEEYFNPLESDLDPYSSTNLTLAPVPTLLSCTTNKHILEWIDFLLNTWKKLCRAVNESVMHHRELHTLIWVPHPFVVPGARFREGYYWDSYWVVKGLMLSGLSDIAQGMVLNMVHLIHQHGFVPNGMRSYYLNRSQPPLLSHMVLAVGGSNIDFLKKCYPALLKEYQYWTSGDKAVSGRSSNSSKQYTLSRYYANWTEPRPESYREDVATLGKTGILPGSDEAKALYRNLASAAESGWDFSSRWLADGVHLETIRTTSIIPADLNGFLYAMEQNIEQIAQLCGDTEGVKRFASLKQQRLEAINELMWDKSSGQWRDLILQPGSSNIVVQSHGVLASNWIPLWCSCCHSPDSSCGDTTPSSQALAAIESLQNSGLLHPGGIAASLVNTGQQWDFPNAWPPLQAMLAEGCRQYGGPQGETLARDIAQRYLKTAYEAWKTTGRMFEKFDATAVGVAGGGGEYEVVDGFGWTNGVALMFLEQYGFDESI